MEVCIDTQWYRDEVTGDGELRPITEMSQYSEFGQEMGWNEADMAMELVRGQKNIFIPILPEDPGSAARDPRWIPGVSAEYPQRILR